MIYYLNADTGDNANAGTSALPWETMVYAHTTASSGDTIICQDSTEHYAFANITFAKDLIIQGESNDASGAVFDGEGGTTLSWKMTGGGHTIVIENLTFEDTIAQFTSLINFSGDINTATIKGCMFRDIGTNASKNNGLGLIGSGNIGSYINVTVENCIFNDIYPYQNSLDGCIFSSRGWGANSSYTIKGCTCYFKSTEYDEQSIFNYQADPYITTTVTNCIFSNETGGTVKFDLEDTLNGFTITYSDFYNISTPPDYGDGVITSDPLFVDSANGNFNLRPSSPCFDTATLT